MTTPPCLDSMAIGYVPTCGGPTRLIEVGRGDRTIVFLHGLTGHAEVWLPVMSSLEPQFRMVAPDLMGRGFTPLPRHVDTATAYEQMVAQVIMVLDAIDVTGATVVGSSLGAFVAAHAALRSPSRVARLVLVGSGLLANTSDELRRSTGQARRDLRWLDAAPNRARALDQLRRATGPLAAIPDELVHARVQIYGDREVRDNVRHLAEMLNEHPPTGRDSVADRMGEIAQPTLLIWGSNDPRAPIERARRLRDRMPQARLVVVEGSGHFPFLDDPAAFAREVSTFAGSEEWR